jgi:phosphate-selective porin
MRNFRNISILAALAAMTVPASAASTKLTVVTVDPGAVVCVFSTKCSVTPADTMGSFPASKAYTGNERLQSRTYAGERGSKAAGNTAYIYRIDFTRAVRSKNDMYCADGVDIDFGPVTKLPYGAKGAMGDVFVINSGGANFVGVQSAEEKKDTVSIEFASPVCPSNGGFPGQSTFFFGMASPKPPKADTVTVSFKFGGRDEKVPARIPSK